MRHFDALGLVIGGMIATALGGRSLTAQTRPVPPPTTRVQQPTTAIPKTVPLIVLRVFQPSIPPGLCSPSSPPEFIARIHTNRSSGTVAYQWEVKAPVTNPGFPDGPGSIAVSDTLTAVSMKYRPRYLNPGVAFQLEFRLNVTTPNAVSSPWVPVRYIC